MPEIQKLIMLHSMVSNCIVSDKNSLKWQYKLRIVIWKCCSLTSLHTNEIAETETKLW